MLPSERQCLKYVVAIGTSFVLLPVADGVFPRGVVVHLVIHMRVSKPALWGKVRDRVPPIRDPVRGNLAAEDLVEDGSECCVAHPWGLKIHGAAYPKASCLEQRHCNGTQCSPQGVPSDIESTGCAGGGTRV